MSKGIEGIDPLDVVATIATNRRASYFPDLICINQPFGGCGSLPWLFFSLICPSRFLMIRSAFSLGCDTSCCDCDGESPAGPFDHLATVHSVAFIWGGLN